MKKLIFAAAAVAGMGAFALESANVVGYNNTAAGANFNWYAPTFSSVGANTIDINTIQLDDGGIGAVGWGDTMQVVGPLGNASVIYLYYDKSMNPAGEEAGNYWGDAELQPVSVSFDHGDSIAIDNANGLTFDIVNSGEVSTNDVSFAAGANFNWSGNPFPAPININAVQLDDGGIGTVGWGDTMQIVGPLGNASVIYLYYDKSMNPAGEEAGNFWGDAELQPVNVTLQPGSGFAIDNANGLTFDIKIACPY
ncbi:MAG: hypothetical protein J6N18_09920 [Kiritimatiellae bacterium]|nr:hypothetical protein [Kiritimatiellia bacterium]